MNSNASNPIGQHRWAIAEGYIPAESRDPDDPRFVSHEAACLLSCNDSPAQVTLRVYFEDREPAGPYSVTV